MLRRISGLSIILAIILLTPSLIGVNALTYTTQGKLVHTLPSGTDLFIGRTSMGITYDPTTNTYWSVNGGSAPSNIYQQSPTGTFLTSSTVNLDTRKIIYRPQDGYMYIRNYNGGLYRLNKPFNGSYTLVLPNIFQFSQCGFTFTDKGNIFDFYNGRVREYNFSTGVQIRNFTLTPLFPSYNTGTYSWEIASNGTHIYFLSSKDIVYVYDINGIFATKISLNQPTLDQFNAVSSFSYTNGRIYVDDTYYDKWFGYEITQDPSEWAMFHDDLSRSGYSPSAAPSTNRLIWNYTTGGSIEYSSPAVVGGRVYVGSTNGKLYCLNQSTGKHIWNYTTGAQVFVTSPAVASSKVYVGSDDGRIYCLNAISGVQLWNYTIGGGVHSSPAKIGRAHV